MNQIRHGFFMAASRAAAICSLALIQSAQADTCSEVRDKMLGQPLAYKDWAEQLSASPDETKSVNVLASALAEDHCRKPSADSKDLPSYKALMNRLSEIIRKHQASRRSLIDQLMDSAP